ncbi:MAG TPA: Hsp70 family protein, partial [Spirochaetia bacterium]|nr:Hsp70 family protein [Spirochaetia bacterium]
ITISGSTNLDKQEIDRMVKEAEANASDDRKRRDTTEERNQADSLAYHVERAIRDLGDKVPAHEKAHCEQLISEIRTAIKEEAPLERIRQLKSDLEQASHNISQSAYKQPGEEVGAGARTGYGPGGPSTGTDDDAIDADYREV